MTRLRLYLFLAFVAVTIPVTSYFLQDSAFRAFGRWHSLIGATVGLAIAYLIYWLSAVVSRRLKRPKCIPPEDVRVTMSDGRVIPCECRYLGHRGSFHHWAVVWTFAEMPVTISARRLPACTAVRLLIDLTDRT